MIQVLLIQPRTESATETNTQARSDVAKGMSDKSAFGVRLSDIAEALSGRLAFSPASAGEAPSFICSPASAGLGIAVTFSELTDSSRGPSVSRLIASMALITRLRISC